MTKPKPLVLVILDGWGHRTDDKDNAIAQARTPFFDTLMKTYPHTMLNASEEHVGLPGGTIGNSEIGHMTIGAGKVIDTDLVRISKAMQAGEFNTNPAFLGMFEHVKKNNSSLHVIGLVSAGGVHSHQEHLHGFLQAAKKAGIDKVVIHAFTDGRDVPPQSAANYLKELEEQIAKIGLGYIATASGRFFALDRDKNWHRTEAAEAAIFEGKGREQHNREPSDVLRELYQKGELDEHLEPLIFLDGQHRAYKVADNDGILFFNFRTDRPRQLSRKIMERTKLQNLYFVTMTEYDPAIESHVAFPKKTIDATLAGEISLAGLKQAHIAETEKYAHVTFFFNGGRQKPFPQEHDILIESRRDIKTHDQAPEMRAQEIADAAIKELAAGDDFLLINFANADMVGHTANKPAIITAVETVDSQLKRVVEKVLSINGTAIVTADHGNAELNIDEQTGEKHTAHTLNLVPFILIQDSQSAVRLKQQGNLADIAPTVLQLMDIKQPPSMTGESLIV